MKDLTYFWAGIISVILIALAVWVSFFAPFAHAPKKPLEETTQDASLKPKEESIIKEEDLASKDGLAKTLPQAAQIQKEEPLAPFQKQESDLKDKVISLMEKLKNNNSDIAQAAADELVSLGRKTVVIIGEMLKISDEPLRGELTFILGRIKDKEVTPFLIEALNDENAYIRRNTVEAIGKVRDEESIPALIYRLSDEDNAVREKSAWALGELRDSLATGELLNRLNDQEESDEVKTAVLEALSKIKDQSVTGDLVNQLKLDVDQGYKNEVVAALGEIADPLTEQELSSYLDNLKQDTPEDQSLLFGWQGDVKIAEEALMKIRGRI